MSRQSGDWTPRNPSEPTHGSGRLQRPRWEVSLRAFVVVLAMIAAAIGVLWLEAAGVEDASAQLSTEGPGKVAIPSAGAAGMAPPPASAPVLATPATPGASSSGLIVHVAGAVKYPGVFTLPPGSRVFQAIAAAGGALSSASLSSLNLAAPISDGSKIYLPTPGEVVAPEAPGAVAGGGAGSGAGAAGGAPGTVNVNTATAAELETLPGVGPVLAQRIVDWRTDHGAFSSVDGLSAVSGIGPKLLAGLRESVSVS